MNATEVKEYGNYLKLADGQFAWPGGYEIVFITDDSGILCSPCVVKEWETISEADSGDGWFIDGITHTGEYDGELRCDHCYTVVQEAWDA